MKYNFNSEKLREKRKALRIVGKNGKNKMVSQNDFMELLKDRGCSIGRNSLSKLENGEIPDELSFKDILAFCDVLGCDINYLLDISDYSTKELETVSAYTGLSEKAVKELHKIKSDEDSVTPALSNLLENHIDDFIGMIASIDSFCLNTMCFNILNKISKKKIEDAHDIAEEHRNRAAQSKGYLDVWINHLGYNSFKDIYYTNKLQKYVEFLKRPKT